MPAQSPKPRRHGLRKAARLGLVVMTAYYGMLFAMQRGMLFPGTQLAPHGRVPDRVERLVIEHDQGQTYAFFSPAHGTDEPAPLVVYAHGNYELAESYPWDADPYSRAGFHVLVLEYRGYGGSDGDPSEERLVSDSVALIAQACARSDVDGDRVVYHGRSLGAGVLAAVARVTPPRGLCLESSFRSVAWMARGYFAPSFLVRDRFDTEQLLRDVYRGRVLILHGALDRIVAPEHARANAAAAGERGELCWGEVGHDDSWLLFDPERLVGFVAACWGPLGMDRTR